MVKVKGYSKDTNVAFSGRKGIKKPLADMAPARKERTFKTQVVDEIRNNVQKELDALVDEIDDKGKKFSLSPNVENLNSYKRSVKEFLVRVNKNTYKVMNLWGRRLDHKIVRTINQKLEALSYEVIHKQESNLMLVDRISEIRGLIIDLLL